MRRIVVALVAALLALTLIGCGGGGEAAAPAETTVVEAPDAEVVVEPTYMTDRSGNDSDVLPAPFPTFETVETPAVFTEKLNAGRPMLIFFYDDAQQVTVDQRAEIDAVMTDYRGLVDLVTFSVGGPAEDPTVAQAVAYAGELSAVSTPYTLIVDGGGYITWRSKGYAERGIIEREVDRASR